MFIPICIDGPPSISSSARRTHGLEPRFESTASTSVACVALGHRTMTSQVLHVVLFRQETKVASTHDVNYGLSFDDASDSQYDDEAVGSLIRGT